MRFPFVMGLRIAVLVCLAVIGIAIGAIRLDVIRIPPHLNPWAPLSLAEAPNILTRLKLDRVSRDADMCRATLEQSGWTYTPIDDEVTQPGCGYTNAVRIERMSMDVGASFAVSCRHALSLALWERHVVQPAAIRHFDAPVTRLEHFGSYACRGVYGRPNARMSHHATADALDVAGFVIADTRVRVVTDWGGDDRKAAFLHEVHDGACSFFDSVYGPEYNAAHRDHFHLDRGSFRTPGCRTGLARGAIPVQDLR